MRIGILGEPDDVQVRAVAQKISALGAEVVFVAPSALESTSSQIALVEGELLVDEIETHDVAAWWIKQLPSALIPSPLPGRPAPPPEKLYEIQVQARERVQLVLSWLLELDDLGVPIVNPPRSGINFLFKPYQLARMRRAGVPVPKTLYTSSPDAAHAFRREVGASIVKPIAGGAHTRDFDDQEVQDTLHLIRGAPIVMQERIRGQHIRVTMVGEEIVSAVVIESTALDYREDPTYHTNARYSEANLDENGRRIAVEAARASRLVYTGIDILRDGDRHVVLECNTSPIYLDIERRMGHPISLTLAAYLVARASERAG